MDALLKSISAAAIGFVLGLAVNTPANASINPLSAEELTKEFGKGSTVCKWTGADGVTKGEDYYYKNQTAWSGDADRNVGDTTQQGSWRILGSGFWTKFDQDNKATGTGMNLEKVGEKTYKAYNSARNLVMTMTCK